jgi:glycosyltransferase involved in cell wall biosynthesis
MRILFALSGLRRYNRGAEIAFISVAKELAKRGDRVTLIGSGMPQGQTVYRFLRAGSVRRECFESFPFFPPLRSEDYYEELTFVPSLWMNYRPCDYEITITCSYPFTNWILRRPVLRGSRPRHVFVTQNGDWPAFACHTAKRKSEYRFFGCDGLICTNPDFFERNRKLWNCRLIPNGVDCDRFQPGSACRKEFGIPEDRSIVLMVSALIPSKQVEMGIEAVSRIPDAHLVVAGDGPLRKSIAAAASEVLPDRFTQLLASPEKMPLLYRSADVFLHCSKDESFGNVLIEAMACGLPIVAHDTPRVRWIVGDAEFLVDTGNLEDIANGIRLARQSDSGERQKRVVGARKFSWTKIASEYREFFEEVIAGSDDKRVAEH